MRDLGGSGISLPLFVPRSAFIVQHSSKGVVVMGQAGVDLPDPLETRPTFGRPPAGAAGARPGGAAGTAAAAAVNALPNDADEDDLLSQLAGEEIDRLLAAADLDAEPLPELPAPVPVSRSPS